MKSLPNATYPNIELDLSKSTKRAAAPQKAHQEVGADGLGRRLWFETQTARTRSPQYSEGVVGLLCSSIVGKGLAIIFASQYNAMQVAVDARSWRSVSG